MNISSFIVGAAAGVVGALGLNWLLQPEESSFKKIQEEMEFLQDQLDLAQMEKESCENSSSRTIEELEKIIDQYKNLVDDLTP